MLLGPSLLALLLLPRATPAAPAGAAVESVRVDKPGAAVAVDLWPASGLEFSRCVDAGRCARPSYDKYNRMPEYGREPAMAVTWFMARDYCAWVGRRLPTLDEYQQSYERLQFPGCCARQAIPREWVADEPSQGVGTQVRASVRQGRATALQVLRLKKSVGYDSSTVRCAVDLPSPGSPLSGSSAAASPAPASAPAPSPARP